MYKIRGPFLVIAPLSTIPHWKREFENWTEMNAIVYHGNSESRALLRTYEVPKQRNNMKSLSYHYTSCDLLCKFYVILKTANSFLFAVTYAFFFSCSSASFTIGTRTGTM